MYHSTFLICIIKSKALIFCLLCRENSHLPLSLSCVSSVYNSKNKTKTLSWKQDCVGKLINQVRTFTFKSYRSTFCTDCLNSNELAVFVNADETPFKKMLDELLTLRRPYRFRFSWPLTKRLCGFPVSWRLTKRLSEDLRSVVVFGSLTQSFFRFFLVSLSSRKRTYCRRIVLFCSAMQALCPVL